MKREAFQDDYSSPAVGIERYRRIFDQHVEAIYLLSETGRILDANQAACKALGRNHCDVLGMGIQDLDPHYDVDRFQHLCRGCLENKAVVLESENIRVDGTLFPVEVTFISFLENGNRLSCGFVRDITERKKTERTLMKNEERFRMAAKAAHDLIWEWDATDDTLQWFNDIDGFLGYDEGEISRDIEAWLSLIHPQDRIHLQSAVDRHRSSTQPIQYEYRMKHRDGSWRHLKDQGFPLLDDQGRPYKWVGVCTDITERRRVELELENKAKEMANINKALNMLLRKKEKDHQKIEQNINEHFEKMIQPFLNRLRESITNKSQKRILDIIETEFKGILSPFTRKLSEPLIMLTPCEIQIASLIKQGLSNKEMARALNCAVRTIDTHRANIRRKLDLKNKKVNLRSYLSSL